MRGYRKDKSPIFDDDSDESDSKSLLSVSLIPSNDLEELKSLVLGMEGNQSPLSRLSPVFSSINPTYDSDVTENSAALHAENILTSIINFDKYFIEMNIPKIENGINTFNRILNQIKSTPDKHNRPLTQVINKANDIVADLLLNPVYIHTKRDQELKKYLAENREHILYSKMLIDLTQIINNAKKSLNEDIHETIANNSKKTPSFLSKFTQRSAKVSDPQIEMTKLDPKRLNAYAQVNSLLDSIQVIINTSANTPEDLVRQALSIPELIDLHIDSFSSDKEKFSNLTNILTRLHHNMMYVGATLSEANKQVNESFITIIENSTTDALKNFNQSFLGKHLQNIKALNKFISANPSDTLQNNKRKNELAAKVIASKEKISPNEMIKFQRYDPRKKSDIEILLRMLPDDKFSKLFNDIKRGVVSLEKELLAPAVNNQEKPPSRKNTW